MSIIRDPDTYERYEKSSSCTGVRHVADLAYQTMLGKDLFEHEILGDIIKDKLIYYPP